MPYTVGRSFDNFIDNISISGDQQQTCAARRDNIVSLLGNDFTILEAFASGSIPKYTAVQGSDLDVIVVLHFGKHIENKKPSEVLQNVRDALSEYRIGVRKNGQAVTLGYKIWPDVDIVPVSRIVNDDGSVSHYNVPDMNREQWVVSRPKSHAANMKQRASDYGPQFRRMVRMIKWWNRQHSSYLQSYHIEALALEFIKDHFSDYPWNLYQFFKEAHARVQNSFFWYEGASVDDYLGYVDRQEAVKRLDTAREKSLNAWLATYDKNDDHQKAIGLWRQIFGDKFPAYGS